MEHQEMIHRFYRCFAAHDAEGMVQCYHTDIEFSDPAFGRLSGKQAGDMWRMLIGRSGGNLRISYENVQADGQKGGADWVAEYVFSQTGRPVVNHIRAEFEFRDGKIIRHNDHFDLGRWARQALGWKGWLVTLFPAVRKKLQTKARLSLDLWQKNHNS